MIMTYQMKTGRPDIRGFSLMVIAFLWSIAALADDDMTDLSGSLGYTYRSLSSSSDGDTVSNQLRGTINGRSYLWQPWFATAGGSLTVTQDGTEFSDSSTNENTLVTG